MKISVIMASYNYVQYIEEAINSVLNQSYADWELIIVDDGSIDNSVEIIRKYCQKDSRIKFLQHLNNQNKGLKETILLGLENATGEWVAFLESDDFWNEHYLEAKAETIKEYPEANLVFNKVKILGGKSELKRQKKLTKTLSRLSKINFPKYMFYDFFIDNLILTFSCVAIKKDAIKYSYFNTPNDARLDWWLWIHLAFENKFNYIDQELTTWRLHQESYIKQNKISRLSFIQAKAYKDVYKNNGKPFKLLLFIIFSYIKMFFVLFSRKCLRL